MSGKYAIPGTDLLTVTQAAKRLRVQPRRLQRWLQHQGRDLGLFRVGRAYLIPESTLAQITPPPLGRPKKDAKTT